MAHSKSYITKLRQILVESLNEEDLRTLAFDLEVDYESLPGRGKAAKARELVAELQRKGRLPELAEHGSELRPHLNWIDEGLTPTSTEMASNRRLRLIGGTVAGAVILVAGVAAFFLLRPPTLPPSDSMVEIKAEIYPDRPEETAAVGSFWIDRTEATNAQFKNINSDHDFPIGEDAFPVLNLSWDDAQRYCQKVNKRLPTEAEWVLAARGPEGRLYPWGNDAFAVDLPTAVYPVSSVPVNRSFFGLFDTFGNAGEWVDEPFTAVTANQKVSRGGSFNQQSDLSRALPGDPSNPVMAASMGVRCAADEVMEPPISTLGEVLGKTGAGADDFAVIDPAWLNESATGEVGYHPPDYYHMSVAKTGLPTTAFFTGVALESFIVEADIFVDQDVSVPEGEFRYGIAFRHKEGRYYTFVINLKAQQWALLKVRPAAPPETVAQGSSQNINGQGNTIPDAVDRLTIIANGPAMTFNIDGQMVAHVNDDEFNDGQIGFFGESTNDFLGHVHFDNIYLQVIDPSENHVTLNTGLVQIPEEAEIEPEGNAVSEEPITTADPTREATFTPEFEPANPPAASSMGMVSVVISGTYRMGGGIEMKVAPFWIDKHEVNNSDYAQFMADTGSAAPSTWNDGRIPPGRQRYPVEGVSWEEARVYCQWAAKRLPTEVEWEAAARGPHGWQYPWGDVRQAVSLPTSDTYIVGSQPHNRSYFGVFDMVGNVWEWVDSPYTIVAEGSHVVRGGNYSQMRDAIEPLSVAIDDPNMIDRTGFRCAAGETYYEADPGSFVYTFEDFTGDAERGWTQGSETDEGYFIGYHATDFYHVDLSRPNDCLMVFNDSIFDNIMVESVNYVKRTDANGDYRYGLALGSNDLNFYALMISPVKREWYIVRNGSNTMDLLDTGPANSVSGLSEEIADRLFVIVNGRGLTFFVNGQYVSRIYTDDKAINRIGMVVQTVDESHVHTHFDRLTIWALPPSTPADLNDVATEPIQSDFAPLCQGVYSEGKKAADWRVHAVKPGETLISMATLYGVTEQSIIDMNNILDPNVIRVGETFLIPFSEDDQ